MSSPVDQLERQVARAIGYIGNLRAEIRRLSSALEESSSTPPGPPPERPAVAPAPDAATAAAIVSLTEENERLRAGRKLALEQVRLLIKEVDKAI
jgi:hypothetical protein